MTTLTECPFCGAPLDDPSANKCPSCGNALPGRPSNAPTLVTPKAGFGNSAEVMDEVKKLIREGNTGAAAEVAATEFGLSQEAAQDTVAQTQTEMQHSGREISPAQPEPAEQPAGGQYSAAQKPEVVTAGYVETPQKPSGTRNWIIGGSIGAAIFLCLCCCLPILLMMLRMVGRNR